MAGTLKFHKLRYALEGQKLFTQNETNYLTHDWSGAGRLITYAAQDTCRENYTATVVNYVLRCPIWKDIKGQSHYHIYTGLSELLYSTTHGETQNAFSTIIFNHKHSCQINGSFTSEVIPYPSFETLNQWSESSYQIDFDDTQLEYEYTTYFLQGATRRYNLSVKNISNQSLTINSIKFTKRAYDIYMPDPEEPGPIKPWVPVGNTGELHGDTPAGETPDINKRLLENEFQYNQNISPSFGLYATYYLDTPVTLTSGEEKIISISMNVNDSYNGIFRPSLPKKAIDYYSFLCGDSYLVPLEDGGTGLTNSYAKLKGLKGNWIECGLFRVVGDRYILNTDPTWHLGRYYEKIGNTYTLLNSKPANWDQNYTNYYVLEEAGHTVEQGRVFKDLHQIQSGSTENDHKHSFYVGGNVTTYDYPMNWTPFVDLRSQLMSDGRLSNSSHVDQAFAGAQPNWRHNRGFNAFNAIDVSRENYVEPTTYAEWISTPNNIEIMRNKLIFFDSFDEMYLKVTYTIINSSPSLSKTIYGLNCDMRRSISPIGKEADGTFSQYEDGGDSTYEKTFGPPATLSVMDGAYFFPSPIVISARADRVVTFTLVP